MSYLLKKLFPWGLLLLAMTGCQEKPKLKKADLSQVGGDTNPRDTGLGSVGINYTTGVATAELDSDYVAASGFLWVANSADGTLSKINTRAATEVARYRTCPDDDPLNYCDPSRTSVNLHGDVVVTNRFPVLSNDTDMVVYPSSVTKFAARIDDCIDKNSNGTIETSTGPTDVLPFDEEECRLWTTPLPLRAGARATAFDGNTDPASGLGGTALIGTCFTEEGEWRPSDSPAKNLLYVLNGDNGAILDEISQSTLPMNQCYYGGAMDSTGWMWIIDGFGVPLHLFGTDTNDPSNQVDLSLECGYGIAVDDGDRVFTAGPSATYPQGSCVQRLSPLGVNGTDSHISNTFLGQWLRGIAVDSGMNGHVVWVAENQGRLYKINQDTLEVEETIWLRGKEGNNDYNGLVGVAVDLDGNVWGISPFDNAAYKYDPGTATITRVPVGTYPYTYSDMTGVGLRNVRLPITSAP